MGNTLANQLTNRLLEDDPPAETPKKKEREVMKSHELYWNALQNFRELRKLEAQKAEVMAKIDSSLAVRAELARHGLHPDDVTRYITRQSVAGIPREEYERLGLNWKNAQPLDVVGVIMNDGQQFYFVEPVFAHPSWATSLAAQDHNRLPSWTSSKKRKGLPYTIKNPDENEPG